MIGYFQFGSCSQDECIGAVHSPFHDVGVGGLESQREFQGAPEVVGHY